LGLHPLAREAQGLRRPGSLYTWDRSGREQLLGAVDVYGLESSRGIYQTPEDSLNELRGEAFVFGIAAVIFGILFLVLLMGLVSYIRNPPMAGPHASSKNFRRRINKEWR